MEKREVCEEEKRIRVLRGHGGVGVAREAVLGGDTEAASWAWEAAKCRAVREGVSGKRTWEGQGPEAGACWEVAEGCWGVGREGTRAVK